MDDNRISKMWSYLKQEKGTRARKPQEHAAEIHENGLRRKEAEGRSDMNATEVKTHN